MNTAWLERARDHYAKGDRAGAIKMLGTALDQDRGLAQREDVRRLATGITGVSSPDEALRLLMNFDKRAALIQRHGGKGIPSTTSRNVTVLVVAAAVVLIAVIGGATALLLQSEGMTEAVNMFGLTGGRSEVRTLSVEPFTEYHVEIPAGLPTAFGWPVLIAIHDVGQTGANMIEQFGDRARRNGILMIAPTFLQMDNNALNPDSPQYQALLADLNNILDEVYLERSGALYSLDILGPVVYGRGAGGTFAASYISDYNLPVAGVIVSNGGPNFAPPPFISPVEDYIEMLILAGEDSSLRSAAERYANAASSTGFFPDLELLPGTGETITSEEVDLVFDLIARAFGFE